MENLFVDKALLKEREKGMVEVGGDKKDIYDKPRMPYNKQKQDMHLPKNRYC